MMCAVEKRKGGVRDGEGWSGWALLRKMREHKELRVGQMDL